jgi:outer membrane protein assembly factor BamA
MKRQFYLLLAAAALLAASLHVQAQKFQPKTIQFKGDSEYSDQELLTAAGLKKGVVLTSAEMSDHSKQLMDSGVFDSLTFKFDGQDLIFYLVPSSTLYPMHLVNLPLSTGKDLDSALHDRFPLYHGKVPADGTLLSDVSGALEEMLAAEGVKATVTAMPGGALGSTKATVMNFNITAPAVRVGSIHVDGVSPGMEAKVKLLTDQTVGSSYDTGNAEANVERAFVSFYADEGYAAVKVHAAQLAAMNSSGDAIDVPFTVTVEEGKVYRLGAIHLPQDSLISQVEIDKVAATTGGTAKGATVRTIWALISSSYKNKGHLDCAITPHPELDETTGTVSYTVGINPGPVYHLAFVKFDNVSDELRSRLMRNWQMLPGDAFDESYISRFIVTAEKDDPALQNTLARAKVTYNILADRETHDVNCVIHFAKQ